MSQLSLGRLITAPAMQWYEMMGDPVTNLGGAVVPSQRNAPAFSVTLSTLIADNLPDTVATRLALRRQLRSLLNNSPLKFQGYVYVIYSDDGEQNGWYVPDQGSMQDVDGASGLATGWWNLANLNMYLVGHRRTHREARLIWMKPLTGGLYPRDQLGYLYSTDFSWLPSLSLSNVPHAAVLPVLTVTQQLEAVTALPVGRDGGSCGQIVGLSDLNVVSYERPEGDQNLSDVVIYDRRQQLSTTQSFYKPTVLADSPAAYWRLDEGTAAVDSSGNGYTGTITSVAFDQAGPISGNTAAGFTFNTSTITTSLSSSWCSSPWTVSLWYSTTHNYGPGGDNSSIFDAGGGFYNHGFGIYLGGGAVNCGFGNGTGWTQIAPPVDITGAWHNITVVSTGAACLVYVDGALYGSNSTVVAAGLSNVQISGGDRAPFGGSMAEVTVIQRALTATQVSALHTAAASGASTYDALVQSYSPLAYWKLNDGGTVAADSSGNGHNGVYSDTWVFNQAGALTGSGDNDAGVHIGYGWVAVPASAQLATAAFSVEAWVKPDAFSGYPQTIIYNVGGNTGYQLTLNASGQPMIYLGNGSSLWTATVTTATATAARWNHYVLTYDGTVVSLYLNGVLAYQADPGITFVPNTTVALWWAGQGAGDYLIGYLDELLLYAYALSPLQVANHYASGTTYDGGNQWEEVYGPDYQWSWLGAGATIDMPVVQNQLARVRYVNATVPYIAVDVWTPGGAANGTTGWVEQGAMMPLVNSAYSSSLVAASVLEYTPDRAVILTTWQQSVGTYTRVYMTLERGENGVTFEQYPAPGATAQVNCVFNWVCAPNPKTTPDANSGVCKIDSQGTGSVSAGTWTPGAGGTAKYVATAGTGTQTGNGGQFGTAAFLGNSNFATSENWVAILREQSSYSTPSYWQTSLVVQQATACYAEYGNSSSVSGGGAPYGLTAVTAGVQVGTIGSPAPGYLQVQVAFSPNDPQQVLEAEAMTLGTGTSVTADAAASGGSTTTATRTTTAAHVTKTNWGANVPGQYRLFARCKVSSGTMSINAATNYPSTGGTVTTTSTTYVWLDLGEMATTGANTLTINAWCSSGSGTLSVDRLEAVLVQDRIRTSPIYSGARDSGQSALFDSRMIGAIVAR